LITHEIHAIEADGKFYNPKGLIDYNALCHYRYLIKDTLLIVRCTQNGPVKEGWLRIDGEGVRVAPIPEPHSFWDIVLLLPTIVRKIVHYSRQCDRYMVRLPGPTGTIVGLVLNFIGKPYGVEFVGHASESFIQSRSHLLLRRFYGFAGHIVTRFLVRRAYCVGYRSEYLRRLYPNRLRSREWVFSGAQLDEQAIGKPRAAESFISTPFKIIFIGRLQAEKGLMVLLHAFKLLCEKTDRETELIFVGDGNERGRIEEEATRLGVRGKVRLTGRIPRGPQLFSLFDESHLFVLPSLTEGMPRSLIEAMARGLPSLGSAVGGIPELLQQEYLFEPGNPKAIAEKILPLVANPDKLAAMSAENFEASKNHWKERLDRIKQGFWNQVVEVSNDRPDKGR
jgi:glycosyltransferase involved in cell wall biosynthesis